MALFSLTRTKISNHLFTFGLEGFDDHDVNSSTWAIAGSPSGNIHLIKPTKEMTNLLKM
jgi:hypothetical protein